jgi:hypothetical protein
MRAFLHEVFPPLLFRVYRAFRGLVSRYSRKPDALLDNRLFDGDDALFKSIAATCRVYAEYGCGKSTIWMARNTRAVIISIDTSAEWVEKVRQLTVSVRPLPGLAMIDLGEIGEWGWPTTYTRRASFARYATYPWADRETQPDMVLIDGRFRVACFLASLLHARAGTRILFDDYSERSQYHVVEEFCSPVERCGRQALFIVPADLDRQAVELEFAKFCYVKE